MILFLIIVNSSKAEVRLPYILSDNMVLQRDIPVIIWGWAKAGEKVTVSIEKQSVSTKTSSNGTFKIQLKPLAAGGPYNLTIKGTLAMYGFVVASQIWSFH
jgi:sialate O-acetylesterase